MISHRVKVILFFFHLIASIESDLTFYFPPQPSQKYNFDEYTQQHQDQTTSNYRNSRITQISFPDDGIQGSIWGIASTTSRTTSKQFDEIRISEKKCAEFKRLTFEERKVIGSLFVNQIQRCKVPIGLISNGTEAKENEFPHMAHIGYHLDEEKNYVCGGSLISDMFVLTAAHCSNYRRHNVDFVRLNSISEDSPDAIYRSIVNFIKHPEYQGKVKFADIALIKFDRKVKLAIGGLRPACLWTKPTIINNDNTATITGWGRTGLGEGASGKLLKAKIDLVDIENCKTAVSRDKVSETFHICATDLKNEGRDTCPGDSGGPIQILQPDNSCQMHVIGVTSFGNVCGLSSSHGVYTKVSQVIGWIEDIVWGDES